MLPLSSSSSNINAIYAINFVYALQCSSFNQVATTSEAYDVYVAINHIVSR
jgi:hypothetical protein